VVDASEDMSSAVDDALLRSSQLAGADVVVVNKVDASTPQRVSAAVAAAKVSAPLAAVETARMGGRNAAPPPPLATASILGLASSVLSMATRLASLEKAVGASSASAEKPSASSSHVLGAHARAPMVINLRPLSTMPMSAATLESWASSLVRGLGGGDILRMKGLIRVYSKGPQRKVATALIQGVRTVLQVDYLPDSHAATKDLEQLGIVIIGRHLDAKLLVDSWQRCWT
jgi:G3E family GTPase